MQILEKILNFKERFKSFMLHRKKVKALDNVSLLGAFPYKKQVILIKECMNQGFLDQEEARFLDHMLNKMDVNYRHWSQRTKWLKEEIDRRVAEKPIPVQTCFDFTKQPQLPIHIPLVVLPKDLNSVPRGVRW